jgi:hypothetical protein
VYWKANEAGQFSAAIGALGEIGVLTGLRIERSERGAPGDFTQLSTEELISELNELGITVTVENGPLRNAMN